MDSIRITTHTGGVRMAQAASTKIDSLNLTQVFKGHPVDDVEITITLKSKSDVGDALWLIKNLKKHFIK